MANLALGKDSEAAFTYFRAVIRRNYYPTYRHLAAEVCRAIKAVVSRNFGGFDVVYTYDEQSQTARIESNHPYIIRISALHEDLMAMIGIRKDHKQDAKDGLVFYGKLPIGQNKYSEPAVSPAARIENSIITADTTPDGVPETQSVFAYCDVIDHQFVGNVKAQLLGVIPVNNDGDALTHWSFNPPYYSRVIAQSFNSIHVWLADHLGQEINFADTADFIVLRLHFRPVPKRL